MNKKTTFTRECKKCKLTLPLNAFSVRNKITSPLCLNCEAQADAEGQSGGGGPKLHKDYYSEHRDHGKKSERNIKQEEHKEDLEEKFLEEKEKKQEIKEDLKHKKVKGFLERLRDTKSLLSREKPAEAPISTEADAKVFLSASEYLKGQHDSNANVLDPSSVRAGINRAHWSAHSGVVRSWATSAAVHSHTQKSSSMINPYNTWQRRAMLGGEEAGKNMSKKSEKGGDGPKAEGEALKEIKSWGPSSSKK